jgi:integrase
MPDESPKSRSAHCWHTGFYEAILRTGRTRTTARNEKQNTFERTGRLHIGDGIVLYSRGPSSPFIWADYGLIAGKRIRRSTGATTLPQAEVVAKRTLPLLTAGKDPSATGPTVGDLLRAYLTTLDDEVAKGNNKVKPQRSALQNNVLPYWDKVPISLVSRQRFLDWERQRLEQRAGTTVIRTYQRGADHITAECKLKAPQITTVQREKTHFIAALEWGSDQIDPWISDDAVDDIRFLPRRKRRGKKVTNERRDALTPEQKQLLLAEFERWEARERERVSKLGEQGCRKNYARRLMALHVRLLLASGLRPGAEINQLVWNSIRRVPVEAGVETIEINPCGDGKTGRRIVSCEPESVDIIRDLKALLTEFGFRTAGDAPLWPSQSGGVVQDFNGSFKTVRQKLGFDAVAADEPLYVCRHTYITDRLIGKIPTAIIAENCGTSEEMIERHYKHLKADRTREVLLGKDGLHIRPASKHDIPLSIATDGHATTLRLSSARDFTVELRGSESALLTTRKIGSAV